VFEEKKMKVKPNKLFTPRILWSVCVIVLSCVLGAAGSPPVKQKGFATSQEAAAALIDAAEKYDVPALLEILGPR